MKNFIRAVFIVLALLFVPFALPFLGLSTPQAPANSYFPWAVEMKEKVNFVFGVRLGEASFADWVKVWGEDFSAAILTTPQKENVDAQLEVFYNNLSLGFVEAKVVLSLEADKTQLENFIQNATKVEVLKSGARKIPLTSADLEKALLHKIKAVSVIPNARLTVEDLESRFGKAEKKIEKEGRVYLIYPQKALFITAEMKQKPLLEYVCPVDFPILEAQLSK